MSYFAIATPEGDGLGITVERMKTEIVRRWPAAAVEFSLDDLYSVRWQVRTPDGLMEGGLYRDGLTLDLDGTLESCLELALWMKEQLMCEVVFTDHLSDGCVVVLLVSNVGELAAAYSREARESSG